MSLDESLPEQASPQHGLGEETGNVRFGRAAEVFVLLILAEAPSYGYEIRKRLEEFNYVRTANDPGVLYRLLRDMEAAGWIASEWNVAGSGPARRYYQLTGLGREKLVAGARKLVVHKQRIERFLETYKSLGLSLSEAEPAAEGPVSGAGGR
ncbi:MAG: PadR family transcriptional regulator [Chloroflexota bacterium]|nr:PadR family transcriptional regulator [Chloroflexota bacterium]